MIHYGATHMRLLINESHVAIEGFVGAFLPPGRPESSVLVEHMIRTLEAYFNDRPRPIIASCRMQVRCLMQRGGDDAWHDFGVDDKLAVERGP